MRRFKQFLIAVCLSGSAVAGPIYIENTPPPIDLEMVNRIWIYLTAVTHAPINFPAPKIILDWEVPPVARMGYQFPTVEHPEYPSQISIAPRTVDMWPRDIVSWGIGHEMTHYVFLMRENAWDTTRKYFYNYRKHHCDVEFMTITRDIADLIWSTYHSSVDRAKMYDEVVKSCFTHPEQ